MLIISCNHKLQKYYNGSNELRFRGPKTLRAAQEILYRLLHQKLHWTPGDEQPAQDGGVPVETTGLAA